jgi:diacylglycerol kinase (ATP)
MLNFLKSEGQRFLNTCKWSWEGWWAAWETEKSLRQWTIVNVLSVLLTFAFTMTPAERAIIVGLGMLVLAAELMNSALEEVVDYLSTERNPRAKKAKDCGSAAVALTAFGALFAWIIILVG